MIIENLAPVALYRGMSDSPYSATQVGLRLKALRIAAGYDGHGGQGRFADDLGLGRTELNAWEKGERRPSLAKAEVILKRYPVTADWLLYGDSANMPYKWVQSLLLLGGEQASSGRD